MPVKKLMIILNKEGVETEVPENYALQEGEVLKTEQPAPVVPSQSDEIDFEKEFFILLEKEGKTAEERDNYKKGLLAAKGKLPEKEIEAIVKQKVEEALKTVAPISAEKDALITKLLNKNSELLAAMRAKNGTSTVTPGGSNPQTVVEKQVWTKEQLEYFKKRGINPDLVKGNYDKFKASRI